MLHDSAPGVDFVGKATGQDRLTDYTVKLLVGEAVGELFGLAKHLQQTVNLVGQAILGRRAGRSIVIPQLPGARRIVLFWILTFC